MYACQPFHPCRQSDQVCRQLERTHSFLSPSHRSDEVYSSRTGLQFCLKKKNKLLLETTVIILASSTQTLYFRDTFSPDEITESNLIEGTDFSKILKPSKHNQQITKKAFLIKISNNQTWLKLWRINIVSVVLIARIYITFQIIVFIFRVLILIRFLCCLWRLTWTNKTWSIIWFMFLEVFKKLHFCLWSCFFWFESTAVESGLKSH